MSEGPGDCHVALLLAMTSFLGVALMGAQVYGLGKRSDIYCGSREKLQQKPKNCVYNSGGLWYYLIGGDWDSAGFQDRLVFI